MELYVATKEQLEKIISETVECTLRNLVPELIRKATSKEFLTKEEVKEMTGWSDRTLQNLRNSREIPFTKHGKKILYPYDGMMKFFDENSIIRR